MKVRENARLKRGSAEYEVIKKAGFRPVHYHRECYRLLRAVQACLRWGGVQRYSKEKYCCFVL